MTDLADTAHLAGVLSTLRPEPPDGGWHRHIYCTTFSPHEPDNRLIAGHAPGRAVTDHALLEDDAVAALPDRRALGRLILIRLEETDVEAVAHVGDLGPHNGARVADTRYVFGIERPAAEAQHAVWKRAHDRNEPCPPEGKDDKGREVTNPAGLDLTPAALEELGLPREVAYSGTWSGYVSWRFAEA